MWQMSPCKACGCYQVRYGGFCKSCQRQLRRYHIKQACARCALAAGAHAICGRCLQQKQPWVDQIYAPMAYTGLWQQLIGRLKYQGNGYQYAQSLTQWVYAYVRPLSQQLPGWRADRIMPVPMHWWREGIKGYNPSALVAYELSRYSQISLDTRSLVCQKLGPRQQGLSYRQRRQNLAQRFAVIPQVSLEQQHVILVDDVITTMATINHCAEVLKKSGVQQVSVWALARTLAS